MQEVVRGSRRVTMFSRNIIEQKMKNRDKRVTVELKYGTRCNYEPIDITMIPTDIAITVSYSDTGTIYSKYSIQKC